MRIHLTLFFLILSFSLFAQRENRNYVKELEEGELQIRQKPQTEGLLIKYLKLLPIKEDTVYAILYIPAACPRCEALISAYHQLLKENDKKNKLLLITAYEDSSAAKSYVKSKRFASDYFLYDTKSTYSHIFSFNSADILGLYILKIAVRTGELLTGGNPTYCTSAFVRQLRNCKRRVLPHVFHTDADGEKPFEPLSPTASVGKWKSQDLPLDLGKDGYVSSVYDIPKFERDYFFYNDDFKSGIVLCEKKRDKLVYRTLVQADSVERRRYVKVPESEYQAMIKEGSVFYIPLSANLVDSTKLMVSYSLPDLFMEGKDALGYANRASFIVRELPTLKPGNMIGHESDERNSPFYYFHFIFDYFAGRVWLGCERRSWPDEGFTKERLTRDPKLDSFKDYFYTQFNPTVATVDSKTERISGRYGRMEDSQRISRTGKYFNEAVFAHSGRELAYTNSYTGVINVVDSVALDKPSRYVAFDIDSVSIPKPDSAYFYKFEYGRLYDRTFSRSVAAMKIDARYIYCLVRYGSPKRVDLRKDHYVYVRIDRKNGKRQAHQLPFYTEDKCLGYGLRDDYGKISPFIFLRTKQGYTVRTLSLARSE